MTEEKKDDKHSENGNGTKPIVSRCIVHNCEECPMFYDGRHYQSDKLICNHPEAPCQLSTPLEPIPKVKPIEIDCSGSGEEIDMSYVEWVVTPDWCPLKVQPVLIEYSGYEQGGKKISGMKSNKITSARGCGNRTFRHLCGLIIAPLLYIRYSFIIMVPFAFIIADRNWASFFQALFMFWIIYGILFGFIMGNAGVMKHWTKLFQKLFKVEYKVVGHWAGPGIYLHTAWKHLILRVNNRNYNLSVATMGGNLYDEEDNIRRKAIMFHLFGRFKKKEVEKPKEEEWVTRHKNKAKAYAESHKKGTRVAAQSKDGTWKEGEIIGEHDWALFTFFFVVKFDDGEIIKQEERKVTKL